MVTVFYFILIPAVSLIILLILASEMASIKFKHSVDEEIEQVLRQLDAVQDMLITDNDLADLPQCVQNWLRKSQAVNRERIHRARVRQTGMMKTSPESRWMSFEAASFFNAVQPGFVWYARVKFIPGVILLARDKYANGVGSMLIKLMGIVPVVNISNGEELNQGSLLRYMAEMTWFPSAAVSSEIHWEEIDSYSARATMKYKGVSGSGVFRFNDQGEVVEISACRPRAVGDHFELTPWFINLAEYQYFNGLRIPSKGKVIWKLENGDFTWFQFQVQEAEYNF